MKHFILVLVTLLSSVCVLADNVQSGYVKTRGRLGSDGKVVPGKRLGSATVVLQGGSSVQSDNAGTFALRLTSLKYYLKDVKKSGYIVSDPDMLSKQYAYSTNPLILVLDEPTAQQDDRLASERRLRRNLQRQLQKKEDELETLKEENKITQEQYREALQKLYTDQESNEKFISEMAERYSKIDFDQLDDFQRQVTAFIQNGELVRADSLLRTKGSMDDREAEINRLRAANDKERKALAEREDNLSKSEKTAAVLLADFGADCYNHFELCKLKFDNDTAAYWLERRAMADTTNVEWLYDAGDFICTYLADYEKAKDYYDRGLAGAVEKYGEKSEPSANGYYNIGATYHKQGDFEKSLNKLVPTDWEESDVEMSFCYDDKYEYGMALTNYETSLKILLSIFGESHHRVATCYDNIGLVYDGMDNHSAALENLEKSLKMRIAIYGSNHPDVAKSYNNIGEVYYNQGDFRKSLKNFESVLNIILPNFGEKHPDVAKSYNNIGDLYYSQGNLENALSNYEKALNIQLSIFGDYHQDVASSYHDIGKVFYSQGEYEKAMKSYEKALDIRLSILGDNHPDIGMNYYAIADVYDRQNNYEKAMEFSKKGSEILANRPVRVRGSIKFKGKDDDE